MKTFTVGQKVWMSGAGGMMEGTVTSFSPKLVSMWVTWRDGNRWCYRKDERNALLTEEEAEEVRERRRSEARSAWIAFDTAVRELNGTLWRTYGATDEMTARIKATTAELEAMVKRLKGEA